MSQSQLSAVHATFLASALGVKMKRFPSRKMRQINKYARRRQKVITALDELKELQGGGEHAAVARITAALEAAEVEAQAGDVGDGYAHLDAVKKEARELAALWKERQAMFVVGDSDAAMREQCERRIAELGTLATAMRAFESSLEAGTLDDVDAAVTAGVDAALSGEALATKWTDLTMLFNQATVAYATAKAAALDLNGDRELIEMEREARADLSPERIAWIDARIGADAAIAALRKIAAGDAVTQARALAVVEASVPDDAAAATLLRAAADAEAIADAADAARVAAEQALDAARDGLAATLASIEAKYATVNGHADVPEAYKKRATLRVQAARAAARGSNLDALTAAESILTDIETSLTEAVGQVAKFTEVATALSGIASNLGQGVLAEQLEDDQALLQKRYDDDIAKNVPTMDPVAGLAAAQAFAAEVQAKLDDAEAIKTWRGTPFSDACAEIDALFTQMNEQIATTESAEGSTYKGPLLGEWQAIRAAAERTGADPRTRFAADVQAFKDKVVGGNYLNGVPVDGHTLLEAHAASLAEEAANEAELAKWKKHTYKAFTKTADRVKGVVSAADGDLDELAAIRRLGEAANTLATQYDFENAGHRLGLAYRQLYELERHPQGSKAVAKDALGKQRDVWRSAVSTLPQKLRDLGGSIRAACEEAGREVPAGLDARLASIAAHFDSEAFDEHLELIANPARSAADVKSSREAALRIVRRYQNVLRKDPMVSAVVLNPFLGGVLTPLHNALRTLDLNLQRCL